LNSSTRFHELRRDDDVDIAGRRGECEDRLHTPQVSKLLREKLEIVSRRAGALCHARNGGALDRVARNGRRRHDPVGENATALTAERSDQNVLRTYNHRADDGKGRRLCSRLIITRLIASTNRSHAFGFWITSAR